MTIPMVTDDEIKAFEEDGVICLRQRFELHWLESLAEGFEKNLAAPGPNSSQLTPEGNPGGYFDDFLVWHRIQEYRDFIFDSPAAEIAARLMSSDTCRHFLENALIKEPGTREVAPWHQDAIFTTMDAHHILQLTVWLPLCDATEENGCLQVSPGVHEERVVYWRGIERKDSVSVPMNKGDVIFIHKLCPHGSGPNQTDGIRWSMDIRYQKSGGPSPRPEWPSLIARSRRDPSSETPYENWRDAWAAALEKHPKKLGREKPSEAQPYTGEMYLEER